MLCGKEYQLLLKNSIFLCCFVLFSLFFLSGCQEEAKLSYKEGDYETQGCLKELGNRGDFLEKKRIDLIVVSKGERTLSLYKGGKKLYTFRISLGKNPKGDKIKEGDFRTPEGTYVITRKKCHPKYYRMISISYPSQEDVRDANKMGVSAGGGITIHAQPFWNSDGKGNEYTLKHDWTNGCIAVTNDAMDELWYAVTSGTPIKIVA